MQEVCGCEWMHKPPAYKAISHAMVFFIQITLFKSNFKPTLDYNIISQNRRNCNACKKQRRPNPSGAVCDSIAITAR